MRRAIRTAIGSGRRRRVLTAGRVEWAALGARTAPPPACSARRDVRAGLLRVHRGHRGRHRPAALAARPTRRRRAGSRRRALRRNAAAALAGARGNVGAAARRAGRRVRAGSAERTGSPRRLPRRAARRAGRPGVIGALSCLGSGLCRLFGPRPRSPPRIVHARRRLALLSDRDWSPAVARYGRPARGAAFPTGGPVDAGGRRCCATRRRTAPGLASSRTRGRRRGNTAFRPGGLLPGPADAAAEPLGRRGVAAAGVRPRRSAPHRLVRAGRRRFHRRSTTASATRSATSCCSRSPAGCSWPPASTS